MTGGGSFEEFYTGAVSRLLGQLFLVTGDLHEAEEVVQEAFARASVRWSWLRDYNAPEGWVRRVAVNLAADRARKLRRQAGAILQLGLPPETLRSLSRRWPWWRRCAPGRSASARRSSCTIWWASQSRRSPRRWGSQPGR
jgi:DNA-directed RNA polymerase specialized sigma24 family protein